MKKIVLISTSLLTALIIIWETLYFNLSVVTMRNIPGTDIKIFGLVILVLVIGFNIYTIKKLYKNQMSHSVIGLAVAGAIPTIIAFIVLQFYRYIICIYSHEPFELITVIKNTLLLATITFFISSLVSFEIVTKKTAMTVLIMILFILIFGLWEGIIKY